MANTAMEAASNSGIAATTSTDARSFAVHMCVGYAKTKAARVFNTPELLDLILSKLGVKDILLRAQLTCRGFRNSIDASPSIDGIFAMTKLLSRALHTTPRTRYSDTITADRHHPGGRLLYLSFEAVAIERLVSSPTFRMLHLPGAEMKRARWWLKRPGDDYLIHDEFLPADLGDDIVTMAGLLKRIMERKSVEMTHFGFEVTELDIWYV